MLHVISVPLKCGLVWPQSVSTGMVSNNYQFRENKCSKLKETNTTFSTHIYFLFWQHRYVENLPRNE